MKDLGAATAYAYAVEEGYTGTEEEFAELMADFTTAAETATAAAEAAEAAAASLTVDNELDDESTNPVQNAVITSELSDLKDDLQELQEDVESISIVPTTVRTALYELLNKAVYTESGLSDELAIVEAWAESCSEITLDQTTITISGSGTVQLTATTVPSGGTVTWSSSDTAVATVSSSGLVTGTGNGTATITATCGDMRARCTATVSGFATLTGITATYTQSGTVYDTADLNSLRDDLAVTAHYSDGTSGGVTSYTLSGTLTVGTSTVTVDYGGKSTTFNVNVDDGSSILYALPHAMEFNGTSDYIDTEVQLRKEDISFTIFFHVSENESGDTSNRTILHCMHEVSPWDGLTFNYASSKFYFVFGHSATFTIPESEILNDGIYAVITHEQGTSNYDVYYKTATMIQHKRLTYNFVSVDETMIIGAFQQANGTKGRYFKGTIYDLSVRSDVASYQSICNYFAIDSTPNLVYRLPGTAVLNGTSDYIDTNVQLFARDVGFALLIDATVDANTSSNQTLTHCMYEQNPYPGMVLQTLSGRLQLHIGTTSAQLTNWSLGNRVRIGIVKRALESMVDVYYVNSGDASISHLSIERFVDYTNNTTLIGAYRTTSDEKGKFMKGTVYDFKIYTGAISTDTVTEWVEGGME